MTRDALQQRALRLLSEHHRRLKTVRAASAEDRPVLDLIVTVRAREVRRAVREFFDWRPGQ